MARVQLINYCSNLPAYRVRRICRTSQRIAAFALAIIILKICLMEQMHTGADEQRLVGRIGRVAVDAVFMVVLVFIAEFDWTGEPWKFVGVLSALSIGNVAAALYTHYPAKAGAVHTRHSLAESILDLESGEAALHIDDDVKHDEGPLRESLYSSVIII
eukprot:COSAG01_NODE_261_length_20040_cov_33.761496_15_plen_159_part_00